MKRCILLIFAASSLTFTLALTCPAAQDEPTNAAEAAAKKAEADQKLDEQYQAREADIAAYRGQYRERGWDEWRVTRFESQQKSRLIPSHWKLAPRPPEVRDWKNDLNHNWQAERMAVYAAQVAAIDEGLGELLNVLKESGQQKDTLVLFLSDNGAAPDGGLGPSKGGFGFAPNQPNDRWRLDQVPIRPGSV